MFAPHIPRGNLPKFGVDLVNQRHGSRGCVTHDAMAGI
jgi:hypothetical protein